MTSRELGQRWAHDKVSDRDRSFILNDAIFYEIAHALGVPSYDRSNLALWEAVNYSRMGHARGLLDFFEHSRKHRKPDDVLSEDFGFAPGPISLPADDRLRFNKDLFHPTFSRCRHLEPGAVKEWPKTILGPIHQRCTEFVSFILSGQIRAGVIPERKRWESMCDALSSGRELVLEWGKDGAWRVRASSTPLPGAVSRLTDWIPLEWVGQQCIGGNTAPVASNATLCANVAPQKIAIT